MRFLHLFSGAHSAGYALRQEGYQCVGTCEVDPHASAVVRHNYPDTQEFGDVSSFHAEQAGPFDLLVGGWPCQGNSLAGRRLGLDDPRSGLFGEVHRIAREGSPKWLLLENVVGALSVNGGRDWAAVVGSLVDIGYGVAWRVFDAKFAGVPQRRRRVYLVGCRGDVGSAGRVLLEPEGVPWDVEEGIQKEERRLSSGPSGGPVRGIEGVVFGWNCRADDFSPSTVSPCLDTDGSGSIGLWSIGDRPRKASPVEYERLQGLPDDYTRYGTRPDGSMYELRKSARYKMVGNGAAVPEIRWIGRRIMQQESVDRGH